MDRAHSCFLLRRQADDLLFDCGESAQLGLLRAKVSPLKIGRVFISHWHADHFAGLLPLMETMNLLQRKEPLHIYGPEAGRFVDALQEMSYYGTGFELRSTDVPTDRAEVVYQGPGYSVSSIPVKHSVPAVGYLLQENSHWKIDLRRAKKFGLGPGPLFGKLHAQGEVTLKGRKIRLSDVAVEVAGRKVAYSGDTLLHEPFFKAITGCDLLVHDGTYLEPIEGRSHADTKEVTTLAAKYGVKRLVLTHISRRYSDTVEMLKVARRAFRNVIIARDGLKLVL